MRILCFGDSNTYGYDPRTGSGGRFGPEGRWVDLLAQMTGWQVRNRGENGRRIPYTPSALAQAQRMLRANASADLVIVMLGTNDLLQGESVFEISARMELFLKSIRPLCRNILLIAPPPLQRGQWVTEETLLTESAQLGAAYGTLARDLGIDFADAAQWNVTLCFDGVHFSEDGNLSFAQSLRDHLLRNFIETL